MSKTIQAPLPPMAVQPVDRDLVTRSTDVDRWLALMNAAIDKSDWKHKQEALAMHMGIDKAYLSRLRSGEKPWRVEHVVALPDDIEANFEQLRAESFGFIVVRPASPESAASHFVAGVFGLLASRKCVGIVVLVLMCRATIAGAQPLVSSPVAARVGPAPYVVMVAGNVADLWTTQQAFSRGAIEGNGLIGGRPIVKLALMKMSFTCAMALAMRTLTAHGHPRIATVLGYVDGGITFGVAAHNHRVAR
jgi:hypothetical protein